LCDDLTTGELPPELQPAVLSIVQELLLNACRHSGSKTVLLGLARDDRYLCVQVQDWGIGFDSRSDQPHKRGLKAIRDLAEWLGGTVDIDSERGKGTCVIVEVPLSRETGPNSLSNGPMRT
jgi:signal transduction histidine kinase